VKRSLLFALCAVAVVGAVTATFVFQSTRPSKIVLYGSFFASDAGRSHGGFEYTALWNATLSLEGDTSTLTLALHVGLGDALTKHEYHVTQFSMRSGRDIMMRVKGQPVVLVWMEKDTIWDGEYDRYCISSWGGDAPLGEISGTISPNIFPGL